MSDKKSKIQKKKLNPKPNSSWVRPSWVRPSWDDPSWVDPPWAKALKNNFSGANLSGANLSGVNFSGANLSGANLSGVKFLKTTPSKHQLKKLINTNRLRHRRLKPDHLLSNQRLKPDHLLIYQRLKRGHPLINQRLKPGHPFIFQKVKADLSGADLSGADLSGVDLSGVDFSGADLSGVDFSGADFSGANLSGADLSGAFFLHTNLENAIVEESWLKKANIGDSALNFSSLVLINKENKDHSCLSIYIYLDDEKDSEKVSAALKKVLETSDIEVIREFEPKIGSWWIKLIGKTIKDFIENQKNSDLTQAKIFKEITDSIKNNKKAIVQIGPLIVIKNNSHIVSIKLTPKQIDIISENPSLIKDPTRLFKAISKEKKEPSAPIDSPKTAKGNASPTVQID